MRLVAYDAFPAPPSRLFRDYVSGAQTPVDPFFSDGWDLESVERAARRTATRERRLAEIAEPLAREQEARGASTAAASARRLADPRAVAVITGQQAGLFGGPLLVLLKALATLRVARDLEASGWGPVVPLFWVAADDHDFAEIRTTALVDTAGALRTLSYEPALEPAGQPASHIVLDESIGALVEDLAACLAGSPHGEDVAARARAAYAPGVSLVEAFCRLLSSLLPDLVLVDASAEWLKRLAVPVLEREIGEGSPSSRLAAETSSQLQAAGYHQQVPVRPGFLNLFVYADGARRALSFEDDRFEIRGTGRHLSRDEAIAWLRASPTDWSPGALLRPLVQDWVLPTAAYVGGPAEIAYHAQIGAAYGHFQVPRPVLLPRPGLTLVESRTARALATEHLGLPELAGDLEPLLSARARASHPEIETAFERARASVRREMEAVAEALGAVDGTLRAAADSATGRALHPIDGLQEKALRALKRRETERGERLRRTREALFPAGGLQERVLGLLAPLARHGEALLGILREVVDPWARAHQVLFIDGEGLR